MVVADAVELVGVYIRVSTAREEMISPELQQRDVDAFLARMTSQTGRPWRIVATEQDLDISGRSFARDGIQRLMTLMRDGGITTIVTYRFDRFGRNAMQALQHLQEVERLGGRVVSVSEPFEAGTAIGDFMTTQALAMAEYYSDQISEGWKRVHAKRIADGLPTNGRERYGYLAHRTTHVRSDGLLRQCTQGCGVGECRTGFEPDPETAPVVQRIYTEYVGGRGFQAIAQRLNADGYPAPGVVAARRSGNPKRIERTATTVWGATSVIDVADSGFAAGLIPHLQQWHPGAHEPLISQELWQAYRRRREAQRRVPTKARSPKWSLAGVAVCGECGGPMYATTSPRGEQYALYCGAQRTIGHANGVYRTRSSVEGAIELWLARYAQQLLEETRLALAQAPKQTTDPAAVEQRRLRKMLERADVRRERLLDAYTDGAVTLEQYKARLSAVEAEAEQAARRLEDLTARPERAPDAPIVAGWASTWQGLSVDARRDVVTALVHQVRVHHDKTVEIIPRWSERVQVTFTKRNTIPQLADASHAEVASIAEGQFDQASAAL